MKAWRFMTCAAAAALALTVAGPSATAATFLEGAGPGQAQVHSHFEEHRFSGSTTSAEALLAWINGGEYVQPTAETRDLTEFQVNPWETARAGDVIFKDDQGNFWIKQHAVRK